VTERRSVNVIITAKKTCEGIVTSELIIGENKYIDTKTIKCFNTSITFLPELGLDPHKVSGLP
jgi:hypothetical protein